MRRATILDFSQAKQKLETLRFVSDFVSSCSNQLLLKLHMPADTGASNGTDNYFAFHSDSSAMTDSIGLKTFHQTFVNQQKGMCISEPSFSDHQQKRNDSTPELKSRPDSAHSLLEEQETGEQKERDF